jgi:AraC family transcriptional activator FtrA
MPDNRKNMTISPPPDINMLSSLSLTMVYVPLSLASPWKFLACHVRSWAITGITLPLRRWMKELRATGGIRIVTEGGVELLEQADTIIVPGWRGAQTPVPEHFAMHCARPISADAG